MIRTYAFKVKVVSSHGNSFLEIKPYVGTNGHGIRNMDPIYFSELNIPIRERTPQYYVEAGFGPEYFLDFENGFDETRSPYTPSNKPNPMRIIMMLERLVDQEIIDFLSANKNHLVNGKIIRFEADDGHSLYPSTNCRNLKKMRPSVKRTKRDKNL